MYKWLTENSRASCNRYLEPFHFPHSRRIPNVVIQSSCVVSMNAIIKGPLKKFKERCGDLSHSVLYKQVINYIYNSVEIHFPARSKCD